MYEEFFGMKHTPFTSAIPVGKLYMPPHIEEVLGRLDTVAENQLFATVTSDVGCGKTTVLRRFRENLDPSRFVCLYLADSKLSPRWLYNGLLEQLGAETRFYRGDARHLLHHNLALLRGLQGKKVVTIIDEAHLLNRETMEELRFLLNDKMDSQNPMALILTGQNELWKKLNRQAFLAVRQRIDIICEIPQMDRSQTELYIAAHLRYAAGRCDIFSDPAIDAIFGYSTGIPRMINKLCFHLLFGVCAPPRRVK